MKKYIILHIALTITFMAFSCHSVSQNLTDPYYIDQNVLNIGTYVNTPSYSVTREYPINNPTNIQIYNSGNSDYNLNSGQFTGEYMIMLYKSIGNLWINELIQNHGLTYKMELVSFPFCMTCWDIGGCAGLTNQRNLNMPDEIYNANSKKWGYLTNIRDGGTFDNQTNFLISGEANVNPPETLVSATFLNSGITDYSGRNYLPHSVIRHVIYIHCNTNTSSTIIDSLVWIYDNTRGRMRSYPFINQNVTGNGGGIIDVMFTPELIIKPFHAYYGDISGLVHHNYDESTNSGWIDGGTINYFDFINASASCTSATGNYFPSNQSDEFYLYDANSPTLYHLRPPVYGILNSILRCGHGSCPAGYAFSNSIPPTMSIPTNSFIGIRQNYFIDRNINFTVINNYDKTLYNPSEVTIDPDAGVLNGINPPIEVVFPESYTFKTILGRSPSFQEVLDAGYPSGEVHLALN